MVEHSFPRQFGQYYFGQRFNLPEVVGPQWEIIQSVLLGINGLIERTPLLLVLCTL